MKKFLSLLTALALLTTICIIGCDTESEGSGSSGGGGGNPTVAITSFTISPSGTVDMTVDETQTFTITYEPANATFNLSDLTYDIDTSYFTITSFQPASNTISVTVKAKKAGTKTIRASLISNPEIKGSVIFNIKSNGSSGNGGNEDETADVTTLNVKVNVVKDVTIDDIFAVNLCWGLGTYADKKNYDSQTTYIQRASLLNFNKTGEKSATFEFKYENNDLSNIFSPYYQIVLINSSNKIIGNLEHIYQEENSYSPKTVHNIEVTITGHYVDQAIELK